MTTQSVSSSTIKLNVPSGILLHAKEESSRIGISVQDFIRMLLATYFANSKSIRAISHDQTLYNQAQEEIRQGQYKVVRDKKELNHYLNSLKK